MVQISFCLLNWIFLAINLGDVWFFNFNGRRLSFDTLTFLFHDIGNQAGQLAANYWFVALVGLAIGALLWRSFPENLSVVHDKPHVIKSLTIWLIVVSGSVALIRNSFQVKPLLPGHAFVLSNPETGHAILNTPFLLFKTFGNEPLEAKNWLPEREVKRLLKKPDLLTHGLAKGYNVVLLILESFGTEYTGLEGNAQSYTPFLDSLAKANLWFPHHFATGRTSKDAMPALLAGIPAWMDEPFASSQYATNSLDGLGIILQKNGYQTAFYHGGKNGTMGFDILTKMAGFRKYVGLNEYPNASKDYDGNWGIFDEPFLQFMARDLSNATQPFAAVAFTLSSHQPYTIPSKYRNRFPQGPLPIHEAIGYSDYALKQFFNTASKMPWYQKTVFVITADHTQENYDPRYSALPGTYDVPLVMVLPGHTLEADTSKSAQHTSVSASLLDILGITAHQPVLSRSVFASEPDFPIVYLNNQYALIHDSGVLFWKPGDLKKGWNWVPKKDKPEPVGLRLPMVARIQFLLNGMIHNELTTLSLDR